MQKITFKQTIKRIKRQKGSFEIADVLPVKKTDKVKKSKSRSFRRRKSSGGEFSTEVKSFLELLADFGIVSIKKKKYLLTGNFILQGIISLSPKGDGYVSNKFGNDIFIPRNKVYGALPGDTVEIEIFDKRNDRFNATVRSIVHNAREQLIMKVSGEEKGRIKGHIVDIPIEIEAYFQTAKNLKYSFFPILNRKKKQRQSQNNHPATENNIVLKKGDWLLVKPIGHWFRQFKSNMMEVNIIAKISNLDGERDLARVAAKYNLPAKFPPAVIHNLETINWKNVNSETVDYRSRRDLRSLYAITIDGKDAKDFDDAISLEEDAKYWTLYVHIADVSHYVKKDTLIDIEAVKRGTSVYLLNKVLPMLPEELSNGICSLQANKDRLSMTCEMKLAKKNPAKIVKYKFYTSVIKVNKRYTYVLANEEKRDEALEKMKLLSQEIKKTRIANGKLELMLEENRPVLDKDGIITGFTKIKPLPTNSLIEEFMLSANICAANFLKKNKTPALHREHESMDDGKLENLNNFLRIYGFKFQLRSTEIKDVQAALRVVENSEHRTIFSYLLLRSFKQAYYSPEGLGHWALAFDDYAHFTSPIRRYPDLIVHRTIKTIIEKKKKIYSPNDVAELGDQLSKRERVAMEAERDMLKIKACHYFEKVKAGTVFTARLSGLSKKRLYIQIEEVPVEGVVELAEVFAQGEFIMSTPFSVVMPGKNKSLFLGDKLKVSFIDSSEEELKIFFKVQELIED